MTIRIPQRAAAAALAFGVLAGGAALPAVFSTAAVASDGGHITPDHELFEAAVAHQILLKLNEFRVQEGREPVTRTSLLDASAQPWTETMAKTGNFVHNPNVHAEARVTGTIDSAENIAAAYPVRENAAAMGAQLVGQWENSTEGHREAMLDNFNGVGIGFAVAENGYVYATQVFGLYPDDEVPSPHVPADFPDPAGAPTTDPAEDPTTDPAEDPTTDPAEDPTSDTPSSTPTETDEAAIEYALTVSPQKISAVDFVNAEKGVLLEVTGLAPGEDVLFTVWAEGETVNPYDHWMTADENGVASWRIYGTDPDYQELYVGEYSVDVTNEAGEQLTGYFTVISGDGETGKPGDEGTPGKPGQLPRTGAGLAGLGTGIALLTVGGATVLLTRRRSA